MLQLDTRRVDFAHLLDNEDGMSTLTVKGRNDENKGYSICLDIPEFTGEERRLVSLLRELGGMPEPTAPFRFATLKVVCKFVGDFFEAHPIDEED